MESDESDSLESHGDSNSYQSKRGFLRALGKQDLPREVELSSGLYRRSCVYKHTFFAAVGRYDGPGGPLILKFGRRASLFGLPLGWQGRLQCRNEMAAFEALADLDGVPERAEVFAPASFARDFVSGHPLERGEKVDDEFFPRLETLLKQIHQRGFAYVDLHKPENVMVDDSGRPWLMDFQIAFAWPNPIGAIQKLVPNFAGRRVLARFQEADLYHFYKHWRRCRPDTLPEHQRTQPKRPGRLIKIHRVIHRAVRAVRHKLMAMFGWDRADKDSH